MIELRHVIYLTDSPNLKDLIKQDVRFFVNEKGHLFRILTEHRVEKINFKSSFTFTDFLTGETYTVKSDSCKCSFSTSSSSSSSECPPKPCPPKPLGKPLFQVSTYLYNLTNKTSGPYALREREDLNFWSTGAIVMTATQGSVDVEFELRNQIVANRAPIPGTDFAGYTSNGIFYDTLNKQLYLYNGNGTFTLVDVSGAVSVLINQTTFVDPTYGSLAGVNDDLTAAFQTLAQGAAAAVVAPRTIYVQPGTYTLTAPLNLQTGIQWYFAEGAVVNSTASWIFTDNGADVQTSITGYGVFNVTGAGSNVLFLQGESDILFQGQQISLNTTVPSAAFEIDTNDSAPLVLVVDVPFISNTTASTNVASGSVLHTTAGWVDISINSSQITTTNVVHVEAIAFGKIDLTSNSILGGAANIIGDTLPSGSLFWNLSDSMILNVKAQSITSVSGTQVIYIQDSSPSSIPSTTNISAQRLVSDGGIAWVEGTNPALDILRQPRLNLDVDEILITNTNIDITPFYVNLARMVVNSNSYSTLRTDTIVFCVTALNGADVKLNIKRFRTLFSAFNVQNTDPSGLNTTSLYVNSNHVECSEQLLLTVNQVFVNMNSDKIDCVASTVNLAPISTTGVVAAPPPVSNITYSVNIVSNVLTLTGNGIDINTRVNLINHTAGSLSMNVNKYLVFGTFYNAVYIGPLLASNSLKIEIVGNIDNDSNFLFNEGGVDVDIGTLAVSVGNGTNTSGGFFISSSLNTNGVTGTVRNVFLQGAGSIFSLINNGKFTGDIGTAIVIAGSGDLVTLTSTANFSASINFGSVDAGALINNTSSGDINITFETLTSQASGAPMLLNGDSKVNLTGQVINFGDFAGAVFISTTDTQQTYIDVQLMNVGACDGLLYAEDSSRTDINYDRISVNNIVVSQLFTAVSTSIINLIGNELTVGSVSPTLVVFRASDISQISVRTESLFVSQVNIIAASLDSSTLNLTYDRLNMGNPGVTTAFTAQGSSSMNVNGNISNISGQGTFSYVIATANSAVFNGKFGVFTVSSNDGGIICNDASTVTATFQTLNTQYHNLDVLSTSQIWVKADNWFANGVSNVFIENNVLGTNTVTVGGYMTSNGSPRNIEYTAAASSVAQFLRLLSSILVSSTNSIYSPLPTPLVSLAPSSAKTIVSGVNLVPAAAFFVDPSVF